MTFLPPEVEALALATATPVETAETIYQAYLERTLPVAAEPLFKEVPA